jgi:energy-converting hydrogenase Eha subunit B
MASFGAVLAIATVWLEEQHNLDFAVGLTIGIALLPWLMTLMPAGARLLPQPGAICALVLGSGVLVSLAGLYSGRPAHFSAGAVLAITAITIWVAATIREPRAVSSRRR